MAAFEGSFGLVHLGWKEGDVPAPAGTNLGATVGTFSRVLSSTVGAFSPRCPHKATSSVGRELDLQARFLSLTMLGRCH